MMAAVTCSERQMRMQYLFAFVLVAGSAQGRAAPAVYAIDPAASHVTIAVGKTGVLSFAAGHTHEVAGPIGAGILDVNGDDPSRSRVRIVIRTADLKVSARDEPPDDVPKVQQTMDSDKVLDVARYPEILFESTSIAVKDRRANALDLLVSGRMTLHGVTREISIPVHAELSAGRLTATGRFSIRQTAYGMTPISVGGVVKVRDELDIVLAIAARP